MSVYHRYIILYLYTIVGAFGTENQYFFERSIIEIPYEHMNITKVSGLTVAQKTTLKVLGAIEDDGLALL